MAFGMRSTPGKEDRLVFDRSEDVLRSPDHASCWTAERTHLDWPRDLPPTLVLGDALFCHGTPCSNETCLLDKVTLRDVSPDEEGAVRARLGGVRERGVLCGHGRVPRTVQRPKIRSTPAASVCPPASTTRPIPT